MESDGTCNNLLWIIEDPYIYYISKKISFHQAEGEFSRYRLEFDVAEKENLIARSFPMSARVRPGPDSQKISC